MSPWGSSCPQSPPWDLLSRVPCLQWHLIAIRAGGQGPSLTTPLSGGRPPSHLPAGPAPPSGQFLRLAAHRTLCSCPFTCQSPHPPQTPPPNASLSLLDPEPVLPASKVPFMQEQGPGAGRVLQNPLLALGRGSPRIVHRRHLFLLNLNPDSNPSERSDLEKVMNLSGSRFPSDKWL